MPPRLASPCRVSESESPGSFTSTPAAIRESLAKAPKPSAPMDVDVEEAYFWQHRHVPPGSVLEFDSDLSGEDPPARVAVMVTDYASTANGIWLTVKSLGGSTAEGKKAIDKYFLKSKRQIHICYLDHDGNCPEFGEDHLHLRKFKWFPPGDYNSEFLTAHRRKVVLEGPKLALTAGAPRGAERGRSSRGEELGVSDVEARLGALRRSVPPRVTFAGDAPPPASMRGGTRRAESRGSFAGKTAPPALERGVGHRANPGDGFGGRHGHSDSHALALFSQKVKTEVEDI